SCPDAIATNAATCVFGLPFGSSESQYRLTSTGPLATPVVLTFVDVVDAPLDFIFFQTRKPPTPPTKRITNTTTTPIANPTLLFEAAGGATATGGGGAAGLCAGWGTCGTVTVSACLPGSAMVAATAGCGFPGSLTVASCVLAARPDAGEVAGASTVRIVGALTSAFVSRESPITVSVSSGDGALTAGPLGVERPARSSLASVPAVGCRSPRSFAVARSIASLKPRGTSGMTSTSGRGLVCTCSRRNSCNVLPAKQRRPAIIS